MLRDRIQVTGIKLLRLTGWLVTAFLLFFLIIAVTLQFPGVQTLLTGKITSWASSQTGSRISIERVAIRFPKSVDLKGIYIEDVKGDTLVYAGRIAADIRMLPLLKNRIHIGSLSVNDLTAAIKRQAPDSVFNWQFIADSLISSSANEFKDESETRAVEFRLFKIKLNNFRITFNDHHSGNSLMLYLDDFQTNLGRSDFINGIYHAGRTDLKGLEFNHSDSTGTDMNLYTERLNITRGMVDLNDSIIELASIRVEDLEYILNQDYMETGTPPPSVDYQDSNGLNNFKEFAFSDIMRWKFSLENLEVRNSFFSKNNESGAQDIDLAVHSGFSLDRVNISASNIFAGPDSLNINADKIEMVVSDLLSLNSLSLDINLGSQSSQANLNMRTGSSKIDIKFETDANLLNFKVDELFNRWFEIELGNSLIGNDIAYLLPYMKTYYFSRPENLPVELAGSINGTLSDIRVDNLSINGPGFFSSGITGDIAGLPDIDSLFLNIEKFSFSVNTDRLIANLPSNYLPDGINAPELIDLQGSFRGNPENFNSSADITTSFGGLKISASMISEPGAESIYEVMLLSDAFEIGHLLELEIISLPPSIQLIISGEKDGLGQMIAEGNLTIGNLMVKDYLYEDIVLDLGLKDSLASVSALYSDDFLSFEFLSSLDLHEGPFGINGQLNLEYADINKLGLTSEDIVVALKLNADISIDQNDFFSGTISVSQLNIAATDEIFNIPEILAFSESSTEDYQIGISSGFFMADYSGNVSPLEIPGIFEELLTDYLVPDAEQPTDTLFNAFNLELNIYPDDIVNMVLMPRIEKYDTLSLSINYDSRIPEFSFQTEMDLFNYSGIEFNNLKSSVVSDPGQMDFSLSVDEIIYNNNLFREFSITGGYGDENLFLALSLLDEENESVYYADLQSSNKEGIYQIIFDNDYILLNGEKWIIHEDNIIATGKDSLLIKDLVISNGESVFSASGNNVNGAGYALDINFSEIDLKGLTEVVETGIPLTPGILNGNISLRHDHEELTFIADLEMKEIAFSSGKTLIVSLKAEKLKEAIYNFSATAGHENDELLVSGTFVGGDDPKIDMDIQIEQLDLEVVDVFTDGFITNASGSIGGQLKVAGKMNAPQFIGDLNFNETTFSVPALNTSFYLEKESINFSRQNIRLNNFTITDPLGRRARLNGSVNFPEMDNFIFDLNLTSENFLLMNLKESQEEFYHGHVRVDSDLRIRGTHINPSLEGNLKLNEGSSFGLVLPQTDPETVGDEGVVEFINREDSIFYGLAARRQDQPQLTSSLERTNLNLNIELDRQTELMIIIDEQAGDHLELKGGGAFSLGIDPGGKISLSGRYDILEGEYLLTFYDFVKRNFRIHSGSNIVWTGDPLDAKLNITATYSLSTNPQELLRTNRGGETGRAAGIRQQYPFLVYLKMKGDLMAPDISFELDMPPEHRSALDGSIMARINEINRNESELNKQVFALLIMGGFISENPLDYRGGQSLSSSARSSGSQILTQQLNRMSDRYIRGIDIHFDLESYEDLTDGQATGRTELQMEISRNFLDERMRITIGGNIELEDEVHRQTSPGDIAGDFTVEYTLTPEGNLLIKGFRKKDYGDLTEGDITRTGVSLMFFRNYNKFRELFEK